MYDEGTEKTAANLDGIDVKLTPPVFRHVFAITAHLNEVALYDIMRSLGHKKLETTMIYLKKVVERQKNAINQWSSNAMDEFL